jgi:phage-related protein
MSDQNDLSGKIGLDVTDFKAAISSINRDIRVVESGFRASAASLGDWSKSASGLESRMKALSSEIELQQKKTGALKNEYEKVAKEKGNNSRAAQELQIKLNKENETLGKMQAELKGTQTSLDNMGKEEKQTKDKTEDLDKSEKKATTSTNQFGLAMKNLTGHLKDVGSGIAAVVGHLAKLAAGLAVGLVAAATGAAVAIGALMVKSGEWADQFATLSGVTGVSTTRLQELDYIGKKLDVDLTTMTGSMSKMIRAISSAKDGTGPAAEAFSSLGVSIRDSSGNLRDSEDIWTDAITALGGVSNETERDTLAMTLFGKSAMELNPLITAGTEKLAALADEANRVGAVMSEQDVEALDKFSDSSAAMGNTIKGITGHLAAAFAPALNTAFTALNKFLANPSTQKGLESLRDGISRISSIIVAAFGSSNPFASISAGIDKLGSGSGILNGIGDALGRFAGTFDRLKAGFKSGGIGGLLKSLIPEGGVSGMLSGLGGTIGKVMSGMLTSFAAQPAKLLQIGLDIIQGLASGLLAAIPALLPVFLQLITSFVNFITTTLPTLLQLGLTVVLQVAMGIMQAIPQLIPVVLKMITSFVQFLITNLPMIITAALQMIVTLANGIASALPTLIPTVLGIIPVIIETLLQNLPLIIQAALNLIMALIQGIIAALPILIPEIPKIVQMIVDIIVENFPLVIDTALMLITTIVTALIDNLPMIGKAAIDIITALLDGIAELLPEIITAAGEIITTIVQAITNLIPTVLQVGKDIVSGIWQGIQDAWATLLDNMAGVINGLPDWVKKLLGIASPSKVFADIGKNMALGLGAGFTDSYTKIQQQIGQAIGGLSSQTSMALNGNYAFGGRQLQPAMAPIRITIQGVPDKEMDMRRLARYVATEIQRRQT